jgi:hypothetical protein
MYVLLYICLLIGYLLFYFVVLCPLWLSILLVCICSFWKLMRCINHFYLPCVLYCFVRCLVFLTFSMLWCVSASGGVFTCSGVTVAVVFLGFWWSFYMFWCHCVSCPFEAVLLGGDGRPLQKLKCLATTPAPHLPCANIINPPPSPSPPKSTSPDFYLYCMYDSFTHL